MRNEILGTQTQHFREFAEVLFQVKQKGIVKVMAPEENIAELRDQIKDLHMTEVMQ
jgi:hypothetical protein